MYNDDCEFCIYKGCAEERDRKPKEEAIAVLLKGSRLFAPVFCKSFEPKSEEDQ